MDHVFECYFANPRDKENSWRCIYCGKTITISNEFHSPPEEEIPGCEIKACPFFSIPLTNSESTNNFCECLGEHCQLWLGDNCVINVFAKEFKDIAAHFFDLLQMGVRKI